MTVATTSERILTGGAAGMLIAALALAWLATFVRLMPLAAVCNAVRDYPSIIRAHIDLLLMALFCLAFARLPGPPPIAACILLVIGGFTNPSLFVIRGLAPQASGWPLMRVYRATSFAVSTAAFVWISASLIANIVR